MKVKVTGKARKETGIGSSIPTKCENQPLSILQNTNVDYLPKGSISSRIGAAFKTD
jgi:hypothetical protein